MLSLAPAEIGDPCLHFLDGFGVVFVRHAGADEMRWMEVLLGQHFHHVLG